MPQQDDKPGFVPRGMVARCGLLAMASALLSAHSVRSLVLFALAPLVLQFPSHLTLWVGWCVSPAVLSVEVTAAVVVLSIRWTFKAAGNPTTAPQHYQHKSLPAPGDQDKEAEAVSREGAATRIQSAVRRRLARSLVPQTPVPAPAPTPAPTPRVATRPHTAPPPSLTTSSRSLPQVRPHDLFRPQRSAVALAVEAGALLSETSGVVQREVLRGGEDEHLAAWRRRLHAVMVLASPVKGTGRFSGTMLRVTFERDSSTVKGVRIQWFRYPSLARTKGVSPVPIHKATCEWYAPTADDFGRLLEARVTPVLNDGTLGPTASASERVTPSPAVAALLASPPIAFSVTARALPSPTPKHTTLTITRTHYKVGGWLSPVHSCKLEHGVCVEVDSQQGERLVLWDEDGACVEVVAASQAERDVVAFVLRSLVQAAAGKPCVRR